MAENVNITPGSGEIVAADEIAGAKYQRIKLTLGADGVDDGDVSSSNKLPVEGSVAVTSSTLPSGAATLTEQQAQSTKLDNILTELGQKTEPANNQNVVVASALPAGNNNIGDVDVATLPIIPAGDNNIGNVDVVTLPSIPAGNNNIGDVDVATLPSLPAGTNNIGDVDVLSLPALPAGNNNIGDVDVATLPALPAGTNNIGDVDVLSLPALPAGSNAIGKIITPAVSTAYTDDEGIALVGAVANNRVFGFTSKETTGSALASFSLHHGSDASGPIIADVTLGRGESRSESIYGERGFAVPNGVYLNVITGAVRVTIHTLAES